MDQEKHPANSTRQLFGAVHDFIAAHPGLDENGANLLTYFAFATLFWECARVWPFVSVVTNDAAASTLLLRILKFIFARPVHLAELTLAGLMSLPESPGQILLIDQPVQSNELRRVLRLVSRPGACVAWKGQLREIFRPVVLCTAESLDDPRLLELAIQIPLIPTRNALPQFDLELAADTSKEMRARLHQYREENLAKVRESRFDAPEFSSPTREIAASLGSCIVDDTELQARVIRLLRDQEKDSRVRRTNSPEAVVFEAGLFLCHEPRRGRALVGEVATIASGIFKGRGESIELEPRAVGDILRSGGLFTQRLGRAGRGIVLTRENRKKIHDLAWAFDVRSVEDAAKRCEFCFDVRVTI
jgi:hypothetical protein